MIGFRALPFHPPTLGRRNVILGQEVNPSTAKTIAVGMGLTFTTLSAAAAWVGFHTGTTEKGWLAAAGWATGIAGILSGLFGLMGTLGVIATPSEELLREPNIPSSEFAQTTA